MTETLDKHHTFRDTLYETHGGEDVGIYAVGPYSHLFTGTIDNTFIAHAMAWAACLTEDGGACKHGPNALFPVSSNAIEKERVLTAICVTLAVIVLILLVVLVTLVLRNRRLSGADGTVELPMIARL